MESEEEEQVLSDSEGEEDKKEADEPFDLPSDKEDGPEEALEPAADPEEKLSSQDDKSEQESVQSHSSKRKSSESHSSEQSKSDQEEEQKSEEDAQEQPQEAEVKEEVAPSAETGAVPVETGTVPVESALETGEVRPEEVVEAGKTQEMGVESPGKSERKKRQKVKRDENEERRRLKFMPVVSADTVNRDAYDLDLMLDPKAQRQLASGHRFTSQSPVPLPRLRSQSPSINHISLNKSRVIAPSSLRLSLDQARNTQAGILMTSTQPKEVSTGPVDLQHFWDFRSRAMEKTKQLEEELIRTELAGCSFHPAIIKLGPQRPHRSNDEYYSEMVAYRTRVADKIKYIKSEDAKTLEEEESGYFKPTICVKSRKIDSYPEGKRYERLYELHKGKIQRRIREADITSPSVSQISVLSDDSDTEPSRPFHPHINKRSQQLSRSQPVEDLLYQSAFAREEKLRSAREFTRKPEKLISGFSEHLLIEKFQNELDSIWEMLEGAQPDMSYMKFVTLLTEMSFIENKQDGKGYELERDLILKAWNSFGLSPDQRVSKRRVEVFLYSIMNFWVDNMAASPTEVSVDSDSKAVTSDPGLHISPDKAARLHAQFRLLYEQRNRKLGKSSINPSFRYQEELPFKPKLDKMSKKLAEDMRSGRTISLEDALIAESKRIKEKNEQKRAKIQEDSLKECSFRPETNKKSSQIIGSVENYSRDSLSIEYIRIRKGKNTRNEVLFQLAALAQERKKKMEKDPSIAEEEQNLVQCTFAPDISASKTVTVGENEGNHWGVEETIGRIKKAREDAKRVKVMTERGFYREEEPEPLRFTLERKHKLIPEFNPDKPSDKKPPSRKSPTDSVTAPPAPKPKPKVRRSSPQSAKPVPKPEPNPSPTLVTEEVPASLDPPVIRETSEEELKSEENEPLLTIAVALSETEKDSINYYPGDKVEDLARQFVQKHGLQESDIERLTELITSKMEQTTE